MYLDETLIQTAARLFDVAYKFLGQAADPTVTITTSDGEFKEEFSDENLISRDTTICSIH